MQRLSISKRVARVIKNKILHNIFRSPRMPDDEAIAGNVAGSSTIKQPFWRLSDFLADSTNQLTAKIVEDDRRNAAQTEEEISEWLILYDQSLEFLFAAFEAAYRQTGRWVAQDHVRSAMVMLVSATNHLLLIRHAIAFGYYPETQSLLRAVHERSSLALLFISEPDWSRKFLAGDRIDQVNVDRALADSFGDDNDPDDVKAIYDSFRGKFELRSKVTHPNLQSFVGRTAEFTYEDWKNDEVSALAGSVGRCSVRNA